MKFIKSLVILMPVLLMSFFIQAQVNSYNFFQPDSIKKIINVLAADSMKGRFTGTLENLKAADFIKEEFSRAGLKQVSGCNNFLMKIKQDWYNVVGAIEGKSMAQEVVIFCAHYDHVGTFSTNPYPDFGDNREAKTGDSVFNGANDDASGVSAVICLAKYFARKKNNERTILFVAFTGEELGELGSQYFANQYNPDSIIAVVNIEMIGRESIVGGHPYITGDEYSDLPEIMNKDLGGVNKKEFGNGFFKSDPFPHQFLFKRSDNFLLQKKVSLHIRLWFHLQRINIIIASVMNRKPLTIL